MNYFYKSLATVLIIFSFVNAKAQSKAGVEYFHGTWNVLVKGTPNGDGKMFVVFEKKDTTLVGSVEDSTGKEMSKITGLVLLDSSATFDFRAQGYDVYITMNRKDENHTDGKLMNMFDIDGERVRQKQ